MIAREEKPCCICQGQKYSEVYRWGACHYPHDKFETASWDGRQAVELTISRCDNCHLVATRPSFKQDELQHVYPDDIVPEKLDPKSILGTRKWDLILQAIKRHIPPKSVVCDIGTRYGGLVKQLADLHYDSFGIELNSAAVQKSIELGVSNVFQGMIEDLEEIRKTNRIGWVDAFIMDDVLEHLVNPLDEVKHIAKSQDSGGFIFARQMDWKSWGHRLFRKNWYYLQPAAHMYFFDESSATKLFDLAGYDIVAFERTPLSQVARFAISQTIAYFRRRRIPWEINGKIMYLDKRSKLLDMFMVIAKKR